MSHPKKLTVISAYIECPMCPTTVIGITGTGMTIYARYRWGYLSVRADPRKSPPCMGAWGLKLHESQIGEVDDGILEYDELKDLTKRILVWPDVLGPRPDDSEGVEISADDSE